MLLIFHYFFAPMAPSVSVKGVKLSDFRGDLQIPSTRAEQPLRV